MRNPNTRRMNATVLLNNGVYALLQDLVNKETIGMDIDENAAAELSVGSDFLVEFEPNFNKLIRFERREYA